MFERRPTTRPEQSPTSAAAGTVDQLGIGMSARSQLGDVVYRNHERSETYLQRVERSLSPVETVFHLDVADRKTQFVAGSLGCGKALSRVAYEHAFGASIDTDFGELLERLRHAELIEDDGARVVLTEPESSSTTACCSASTLSAPSGGCETGPPGRGITAASRDGDPTTGTA